MGQKMATVLTSLGSAQPTPWKRANSSHGLASSPGCSSNRRVSSDLAGALSTAGSSLRGNSRSNSLGSGWPPSFQWMVFKARAADAAPSSWSRSAPRARSRTSEAVAKWWRSGERCRRKVSSSSSSSSSLIQLEKLGRPWQRDIRKLHWKKGHRSIRWATMP